MSITFPPVFGNFRERRRVETGRWGAWKVGCEKTETKGFFAEPTGTAAVPGEFSGS